MLSMILIRVDRSDSRPVPPCATFSGDSAETALLPGLPGPRDCSRMRPAGRTGSPARRVQSAEGACACARACVRAGGRVLSPKAVLSRRYRNAGAGPARLGRRGQGEAGRGVAHLAPFSASVSHARPLSSPLSPNASHTSLRLFQHLAV